MLFHVCSVNLMFISLISLKHLVTQGWNLCTTDTDTEHHKFDDFVEDRAMLLLQDPWSLDSEASTWGEVKLKKPCGLYMSFCRDFLNQDFAGLSWVDQNVWSSNMSKKSLKVWLPRDVS